MFFLNYFLAESSTLCVQCNSKYDQHCEENPPGASNCLERTSKRNGCLVTRISTNGSAIYPMYSPRFAWLSVRSYLLIFLQDKRENSFGKI